jgi:hypothetical protein
LNPPEEDSLFAFSEFFSIKLAAVQTSGGAEPRTQNFEPRTQNLEPRTLNLEPRTLNLKTL